MVKIEGSETLEISRPFFSMQQLYIGIGVTLAVIAVLVWFMGGTNEIPKDEGKETKFKGLFDTASSGEITAEDNSLLIRCGVKMYKDEVIKVTLATNPQPSPDVYQTLIDFNCADRLADPAIIRTMKKDESGSTEETGEEATEADEASEKDAGVWKFECDTGKNNKYQKTVEILLGDVEANFDKNEDTRDSIKSLVCMMATKSSWGKIKTPVFSVRVFGKSASLLKLDNLALYLPATHPKCRGKEAYGRFTRRIGIMGSSRAKATITRYYEKYVTVAVTCPEDKNPRHITLKPLSRSQRDLQDGRHFSKPSCPSKRRLEMVADWVCAESLYPKSEDLRYIAVDEATEAGEDEEEKDEDYSISKHCMEIITCNVKVCPTAGSQIDLLFQKPFGDPEDTTLTGIFPFRSTKKYKLSALSDDQKIMHQIAALACLNKQTILKQSLFRAFKLYEPLIEQLALGVTDPHDDEEDYEEEDEGQDEDRNIDVIDEDD